VVAGTIVALTAVAPSTLASSPFGGELHLTKTCGPWDATAGHICTVQSSTFALIQEWTVATYGGPLFTNPNRLSSALVLHTPDGSTATGHCSLSLRPELSGDPGLGTCTFVSGTRSLAGFHANLRVSDDPVSGVTSWDGAYPSPPATEERSGTTRGLRTSSVRTPARGRPSAAAPRE
jgi:hypothetical protein